MTSSRAPCDVLLYVEDPGAANFAIGLGLALQQRGWRLHIVTGGTATRYLAERGVASQPLPATDDAGDLLTALGAKVAVVGTAEDPRSFGLRLVEAATARQIPSVGLVDSAANAAFRFRGDGGNALAFCPDLVLVADAATDAALRSLGLAAHRIVICGHPHWDNVRAQVLELQKHDRTALRQRLFNVLPPDRTVVLFASEISGGLDARQFERSADYSLTGDGDSTGRTEIVIEEFLRAAVSRRRELHLTLRLHPKQSPGDLAPYLAKFDTVSQTEPPLECLVAADAVVGMTSMLMVEAALCGRPTLSIVPRRVELDWLPTVAAGLTAAATTRPAIGEEFAKLIDRPQPPDPATLDRLFPAGAVGRVADAIARCAGGKN